MTRYRLYDASLWDEQKDTFQQQGADSWRTVRPIPDMATTNPLTAYHYAQVVVAFFKDWANLHLQTQEPIYIIDMGAGVGRFAFNFLKAFTDLYEKSQLDLPSYRYVMTDIAEATLDFCQQHPAMQPYSQRGVLDFAVFDAEMSTVLTLRRSGRVIKPGDLGTPLVLVANYFFCALRRDLFYVSAGALHDVYFFGEPTERIVDESLRIDLGPPQYKGQHNPAYAAYETAEWNAVLDGYRDGFMDTLVTFPVVGLGSMERLAALTSQGFFFLSIDVGDTHAPDLNGQPMPPLVRYADTAYVKVNYHAILAVFQQQGALPLTVDHCYRDLNAVGLIACDRSQQFSATARAFERYFQANGPDDIFEMHLLFEQDLERMSVEQIIAVIRYSRYMPRLFRLAAPRLAALLQTEQHTFAPQLIETMRRVEAMNYAIGAIDNLAYSLAVIYFELGQIEAARGHFSQAIQEGLATEEVYFGLVICAMLLDEHGQAQQALEKLLALNPNHSGAANLKNYLDSLL